MMSFRQVLVFCYDVCQCIPFHENLSLEQLINCKEGIELCTVTQCDVIMLLILNIAPLPTYNIYYQHLLLILRTGGVKLVAFSKSEEELKRYTVKQQNVKLAEQGLRQVGNKADLIQRLLDQNYHTSKKTSDCNSNENDEDDSRIALMAIVM